MYTLSDAIQLKQHIIMGNRFEQRAVGAIPTIRFAADCSKLSELAVSDVPMCITSAK